MIEVYLPMLVISLVNFIPGCKMFLKCSWE